MTKRKQTSKSRARGSAGASGQPRATRTRKPGRPANEFTFPTECLISEAGELKTRLGKLLEQPRCVTLDISGLKRIDTAGLQVIAAFVRERHDRALHIEWRGSAPALAAAAGLLGLTPLLGLSAGEGS